MKAQSLSAQCLSVCAAVCLFAAAITFTSCNQNTPDDTKKGGDSTTSHQPANPATWSPAGHVYVYETTWEDSPAADQYWAFVADFFSKDSVSFYQTPNKDLSIHPDFLYLLSQARYKMQYPKVTCKFPNNLTEYEYNFKDTLTFVESSHDYLIFK